MESSPPEQQVGHHLVPEEREERLRGQGARARTSARAHTARQGAFQGTRRGMQTPFARPPALQRKSLARHRTRAQEGARADCVWVHADVKTRFKTATHTDLASPHFKPVTLLFLFQDTGCPPPSAKT